MAKDQDLGLQEEIRRSVADLLDQPGALLPILHRVQATYGCVPASAVPVIARLLNLSRAEVHGVVTFYHDFRQQPAGRHIIKLCQAEACQSMGGARLSAQVKQQLGIDFHQTTADGRYTLEPVYCLGHCACAPAMMVDATMYARLSPARCEEILQRYESQS